VKIILLHVVDILVEMAKEAMPGAKSKHCSGGHAFLIDGNTWMLIFFLLFLDDFIHFIPLNTTLHK
jgi:hypothetical protein